jgi:hypothetical protein
MLNSLRYLSLRPLCLCGGCLLPYMPPREFSKQYSAQSVHFSNTGFNSGKLSPVPRHAMSRSPLIAVNAG